MRPFWNLPFLCRMMEGKCLSLAVCLLFLEAFAGSQEVAHHADKLLCFLERTEIEQINLDIAVFLLNAVLLFMAQLRDMRLEGIAFYQQGIAVLEITSANHLSRGFHDLVHLTCNGKELVDIFLWQGIEVVIYVLHARLEHTFQAIDNLREVVATQMEPGILLYGL